MYEVANSVVFEYVHNMCVCVCVPENCAVFGLSEYIVYTRRILMMHCILPEIGNTGIT